MKYNYVVATPKDYYSDYVQLSAAVSADVVNKFGCFTLGISGRGLPPSDTHHRPFSLCLNLGIGIGYSRKTQEALSN